MRPKSINRIFSLYPKAKPVAKAAIEPITDLPHEERSAVNPLVLAGLFVS